MDEFEINDGIPTGPDVHEVAAQLISLLDSDYTRIYESLREGLSKQNFEIEHEFSARQLVRAFFAYVEGTIYSLKGFAGAQLAFMGLELEEHEWDLIHEYQHVLDDNGKVKHQSAMIRLIPNLKFMLRILGDTMGADEIDFKKEKWWPAFRSSIKVRDRLMHPKKLSDMNISYAELGDLIEAREGFDELLSGYLGARPWTLEDIWPYMPKKDKAFTEPDN